MMRLKRVWLSNNVCRQYCNNVLHCYYYNCYYIVVVVGVASSLVDFVFRAKGIAFYGCAASYNQHFMCYLELHNKFSLNCVAWMLLSGHQKLGHKQHSLWPLFSRQDKPTGNSLPLAFVHI